MRGVKEAYHTAQKNKNSKLAQSEKGACIFSTLTYFTYKVIIVHVSVDIFTNSSAVLTVDKGRRGPELTCRQVVWGSAAIALSLSLSHSARVSGIWSRATVYN
jgi:hypothetical protein